MLILAGLDCPVVLVIGWWLVGGRCWYLVSIDIFACYDLWVVIVRVVCRLGFGCFVCFCFGL